MLLLSVCEIIGFEHYKTYEWDIFYYSIPSQFFQESCPPSHHKPQGSYHIFLAPTVGADIEKTDGEGMHHRGRIRRIRGPPALASGWNPSRRCSKCQVGIDGLDLGEVWDLDVDLNGDSMILVDCGISMGQWGYITTNSYNYYGNIAIGINGHVYIYIYLYIYI